MFLSMGVAEVDGFVEKGTRQINPKESVEFTTPIKAVVKTDPFSKLFLTFFEPFPNAAENI